MTQAQHTPQLPNRWTRPLHLKWKGQRRPHQTLCCRYLACHPSPCTWSKPSNRANMWTYIPELLPKALREVQFNKTRETKEETRNKRRYSIATPLDWMAAFSAYTAEAVHLKPQRAFELAAYSSIIVNLARDGRVQAWSKYDQQFRQVAAVNPNLQWHKWESDIWLTAFMGAAAAPATRPPLQQGQLPAQRSTSIWCNWNKGLCTHPQCKYRHVCFVCFDAGHVTRDCPTIATAATQGTARQMPK